MTDRTRVLLVEDNPGDARLLRALLGDRFAIDHVERLAAALDALKSAGPGSGYEVVLLDLSLPDSHGLDTCRRVRAVAPDVPVLVLTGLNDDTIAVQAVREGAQDWLVKGRTDGEIVERAVRYAIERNRLVLKLRELDRMRSVFLSVVSHDLRSPAASILAGIDLLLGQRLGVVNADQQRVLLLARRSAQRQTRLIRDLLDVAVLESGSMAIHPDDHPVHELVRAVVDELRPLADERGVALADDVPPELAVRVDADRVVQALGNLVSNAVKFAERAITLSARRIDGEVEIVVDDDGPGIPPELVAELFDRFVRTEGPRGGAGLGLWIARGIAQAHHGTIRAENRPEGGARFVLALPVAADHPVAREAR
ncbi:MAG: hybrid sensor histidine kinase/response regulator [Myxococcota bacterium]